MQCVKLIALLSSSPLLFYTFCSVCFCFLVKFRGHECVMIKTSSPSPVGGADILSLLAGPVGF